MRDAAPGPIVIPGLDIARARRYRRTRLAVFALSTLLQGAGLLWFACDRRAARLKAGIARRTPEPCLSAAGFFLATTAISWLASLPTSYLGGHLVERHFGLTRQTGRGWLGDQLKALLLSATLQTPMLTIAYAVMRRRPRDWWLILASAAVPLAVLFSNLAPVLLMPLFNRFTPVRDEELGSRLRAMADRRGVRISAVYEMDMSRQSEKPNAMFTGIGNSRRIILGDTLLERFPPEEVEAVVAHELGHQVHGDLWRLIGFGAGSGFGLAWLLSRLMPWLIRGTRERTGVEELQDEASLPLLLLALTALGLGWMPVQAAFSRALERRADRFAVDATRNGEAYARALERLAVQSLSDPEPPRLAVLLRGTHPPLGERIRAARDAGGRQHPDLSSPEFDVARG